MRHEETLAKAGSNTSSDSPHIACTAASGAHAMQMTDLGEPMQQNATIDIQSVAAGIAVAHTTAHSCLQDGQNDTAPRGIIRMIHRHTAAALRELGPIPVTDVANVDVTRVGIEIASVREATQDYFMDDRYRHAPAGSMQVIHDSIGAALRELGPIPVTGAHALALTGPEDAFEPWEVIERATGAPTGLRYTVRRNALRAILIEATETDRAACQWPGLRPED